MSDSHSLNHSCFRRHRTQKKILAVGGDCNDDDNDDTVYKILYQYIIF